MSLERRPSCILAAFIIVCSALLAATLLPAQDTRSITEPRFPASCALVPAQLSVAADEPSSETAFDTKRIQAALDGCAPGQAVELTAPGESNAFLISPIVLPAGVTLLVDGGVTVFASRNPADYQRTGDDIEQCGTVGVIGNGCKSLITSSAGPSSGSGVMGYGIIDGRGGDKLLIDGKAASYSWWDLGSRAYLIEPNGAQNNPVLLRMVQASNFVLYKITLKNGPLLHFHWSGPAKGLTVWGVKVIAPYTARNTDGIDPTDGISNITITDSYISNGDDQVALSANVIDQGVSNVSITKMHTYSGRGISIGSGTVGGVRNVLVNYLDQDGNGNDDSGNGFRIKSAPDRGGLVKNVTFQNICQRNEMYAIRFDPYYITTSSTEFIPTFQSVTLRNITILANSSGFAGKLHLQGFDANHATSLTVDNVHVGDSPVITPHPRDVHFTLGPGPVQPELLQALSGTGVTYTGEIQRPKESAYACSAANFIPVVGELYFSDARATNKTSVTLASGTDFMLNAVVEPASAEYPPLASGVDFYEGRKRVGSANLSGNGTLATLELSGISNGTHVYTAKYRGDGNYRPVAFGSVTVNMK